MIRKATVADIKQIHQILQIFSAKGTLLPRSLMALYDHVRDFCVYAEGDEVIGCCGLQICWEDMAEIRSLAVKPEHQHKKIGSHLLEFSMEEALKFKIKKLFTLTYAPKFFELHDFAVIDKNELPQKIWADCINCVKFPDCDEIAMLRRI
ncbi:N-acetylglutamate synthase [Desulfatibacillum alkenivorans DSM 16219]|jgi:amino-acid N-acetyltransferase|uniref:N-acetylglutamate synthase n=1 Tax=Desulfatibacillum alkenivorans DSM 16219 TaxID=1121393 RepID=A0A1M6PAA2_9BACT|nr:N-acetyltransferase [Desulfatibacillum alkenivorans]SHK04792.1 N-acetylglutamate synthase [Desulfatibacillum alkenivorans DSM 16219]